MQYTFKESQVRGSREFWWNKVWRIRNSSEWHGNKLVTDMGHQVIVDVRNTLVIDAGNAEDLNVCCGILRVAGKR